MLAKMAEVFSGSSNSKETNSQMTADEEYDKQLRKTISKIERISPKKELDAVDLENLLGPPHELTGTGVDYLFMLLDCIAAVSHTSKSNNSQDATIPVDSYLWTKAVQFLKTFDAVAVRYAGTSWRSLVEIVDRSAVRQRNPAAAVIPLRTAILRLDPTGGTFTSTHVLFLRQCLRAGMLEEAVPVIGNTIHSIPSASSPGFDGDFPCSDHQDSSGFITKNSGLTNIITMAHVQEYFLLGATVYIGLKKWEDALLLLEMVLTSPTQNTATGFMLEAYRKWILVACLAYGRVPDLPKNTNVQAIRTIKIVAKPYEAIASAFQSGDFQKLQAEVNVGLQHWDEDGNVGLALQLAEYLPRFFILNLQKRFAAVPVRSVAEWIHQEPNRALALVEQLILTGVLNGNIDMTGEPVLRFYTTRSKGPLSKSEETLCAELVAQTERTNTLAEYVRLADRKIMFTKDYIEQAKKRATAAEAVASTSDLMDTKWDDGGNVQDEDIMDAY